MESSPAGGADKVPPELPLWGDAQGSGRSYAGFLEPNLEEMVVLKLSLPVRLLPRQGHERSSSRAIQTLTRQKPLGLRVLPIARTVMRTFPVAMAAVLATTSVVVVSAAHSAEASPTAVVLLGDGVGGARFGQNTGAAVNNLDRLLGTAKSTVPTKQPGGCTIDAVMRWAILTAYFDHGHFVGFSTPVSSGTVPFQAKNLVTAKGLRVGDSLAHASQIYGAALRTSPAQGGSWSAKTANGMLDGYLSTEVNHKAPGPRIASIEAGAVGCPAVSP